jgi:GNAT superfamily N-acetyltransferase
MFLCSNLETSGLEFVEQKPFYGEYWGAFDQKDDSTECVGVVAHYWNGNVLMIGRGEKEVESLADVLMNEATRLVAGFIGLEKDCRIFMKILGLEESSQFSLDKPEGLFSVDAGNFRIHELATDEELVPASAVEFSTLFEWMKAYSVEALGAADDDHLDGTASERARIFQSSDDVWVLQKEKRYVCLSGVNARFQDVVQVGPVWTPPEHRGKSFAKKLVSQMLAKEVENKKAREAVLFTHNPAAIRVYESIGFRRVSSFLLAFLKTPVLIR